MAGVEEHVEDKEDGGMINHDEAAAGGGAQLRLKWTGGGESHCTTNVIIGGHHPHSHTHYSPRRSCFIFFFHSELFLLGRFPAIFNNKLCRFYHTLMNKNL